MKKLFLMLTMAGALAARAQSQQTADTLASDSVVVQPSEVRPDSTNCPLPDSMCCDDTHCAEGDSAADGKADHDGIWWTVAGTLVIGTLLVTAIYIRRNNRLNQ